MESINLNTFLGFRPKPITHLLPLKLEKEDETLWLSCANCQEEFNRSQLRNKICDCTKLLSQQQTPTQVQLVDVETNRCEEFPLTEVNITSQTTYYGVRVFFQIPELAALLVWAFRELSWRRALHSIFLLYIDGALKIVTVGMGGTTSFYNVICNGVVRFEKDLNNELKRSKWWTAQMNELADLMVKGAACFRILEEQNRERYRKEQLALEEELEHRQKVIVEAIKSKYCCYRECHEMPQDEVDGKACDVCGQYGICYCLCESFRENKRMCLCTECPDVMEAVEKDLPFQNPLCPCAAWAPLDENYDGLYKLEVVERQVDEMTAETSDKKETHENQQHEKPKVKKAIVNPIKAPSLIAATAEVDLADLAMDDVEVVPGTTTSRIVSTVPTPCGPRKAVHMTNDQAITLKVQKYLPATPLLEWGNVWAKTLKVGETYASVFSNRTKALMLFFTYYNSLCVWRIVGKAPLFASRRYWVSYIPSGSKSLGTDNLGFEWNPSEESEIYVITPWTSETRVIDVQNSLPEKLQITPITDMVFSEGLPTDLNLDVYCAPLHMTLYAPRIVEPATPPDTVSKPFRWVQLSFDNTGASAQNPTAWYPVGRALLPVNLDTTFVFTNLEAQTLQYDVKVNGEVTVTGTPKPSIKWTLTSTTEFANSNMEFLVPFPANSQPIEKVERQISEYSYNDSWKENTMDYGKTGNHTTRVDKHWSQMSRLTIAEVDTVKYVDISQPLKTLALVDKQRHLFYAKHPILKIFSTSIPSANMLFRITQLPIGDSTATLDKLLQLPGVEFDPKNGPVQFRPYWSYRNPADDVTSTAPPCIVAISRIGGTMGVEPIEMTVLYNTSAMEYHHLSNSPLEVVERQIDEGDPIKTSTQEGSGVDNLVNHAADSERRWTYLDSVNIPQDVLAVQIPINAYTLGPELWYHARRYTKWRGTPHFKVVVTNSAMVNSNIHVIQTDNILDSPTTARAILTNIGYSTKSAHSGAIEYSAQWRKLEAYCNITENPDDADLGYLTIVLPLTSASVTENTQLTVYVDPSEIDMKAETGPTNVGAWTMPAVTVAAREASVPLMTR